MPPSDSKPGVFDRIRTNAVMVAAILFAVMTFMGVNGGLQWLEARVHVLDLRVQELDKVERHIARLQGDVKQIALLRNDILEAIETATRINSRRSSGQPNGPSDLRSSVP